MPTNLDLRLSTQSPFAPGRAGLCCSTGKLMYISQGKWRMYGFFYRTEMIISSCSWPQHEVLAAVAAGKYVILCKCIYVIITLWAQFHRFQGGHTNTERGYLPILATKLHHELQSNEFRDQGSADVEVLVSQMDHHPLEFVWKSLSSEFQNGYVCWAPRYEHVCSSSVIRPVYHSACRVEFNLRRTKTREKDFAIKNDR